MLDDKKCLIHLTEKTLLVANTGQRFSRKGVVAVCASHLGTKHNYTSSDPCPSEPDSRVLEAIRERELQTYKTNPDRIFSDFREEEEIQLDYGGRALWELLQNADDAMSPLETTPAQLIGSKGVGFKSVLELTEEPQIHSGPFHFHFSTAETHELLQKYILPDQKLPPLTFRIPHPVATNPEVEDLFNNGYATVICLPLRKEAHSKAREWMETLDPRLLLLCQHLKTLELSFPDGRSRIYEIDKGDFGVLADVDTTIQVLESLADGLATKQARRYRRWAITQDVNDEGKRHSAAICLQVEEDRLVPFEDTPPLHVFFPTKERLPFHALIHASFEVEQSRQHVRGDTRPQLLSLIEDLLIRIIRETPPAVVLRAFVPKNEPESEPAQQIWKQFKDVLQERAFVPTIGGALVKPGEARLWNHDLGRVLDPTSEEVKKAALVVPELLQSCRKSLERLGAEELPVDKHPDLLRHCRNDSLETCLEALKVLHKVVTKASLPDEQNLNDYIRACRKVPCWWTDDGRARPLTDDNPLFQSRPKESLPLWIPLNILDERFQKKIDELFPSKGSGQHRGEKAWSELTKDYLLSVNNANLLHKALIPALTHHPEEVWWSEHGGEALHLFERWTKEQEGKFDEISPVIWEKEERIDLAHSLRLPTNRGWLPAAQCYAGKVWEGPESFDIFFREVAGRGVLEDLEHWPSELHPLDSEKWKGRLRYAGVSWEPKLLEFKSDDGLCFRDTPTNPWMKIHKGNKSEVRTWDYWNDYSTSLKQGLPSSGAKYLKEQWALEFFPECLPKTALDRLRIIKSLSDSVVKPYSKMKFKSDKRKYHDLVDSLALYQLRKVAWLPCKPSLLHEDSYVPPCKAYMPGKGLKGLLPEVNIDLVDEQEGRDWATFLTKTLEVRETLPGPTDRQWIEWLNKLPEIASRKKDITTTARELYEKVFGSSQKSSELAEVKLVPCLVWSTTARYATGPNARAEGQRLDFRDRDLVYWLDAPYLENRSVKEALLKKGVSIFLLELKAGEKAKDWLGLKPLSEAVKVEPQYQQENADTTFHLMERYRQRYQAIQVLARQRQTKVPPAPEAISFQAVHQLSIQVAYQDTPIGISRISWWEAKDSCFLVDVEKPYLGAGGVIADTTGGKIAGDVIENLLKAEDNEEVLERLRQHGVAESELHALHVSVEPKAQESSPPGETSAQSQSSGTTDGEQPKPIHTSTQADGGSSSRTATPTDQKRFASSESSSTKKSDGVGSGGWSNQEAQEEGRRAEKWLREQLKKLLTATEWNVSLGPEKDDENRETDIVLRKGKGEVHIEAKHMKSDPRLYWSEREVSKAKEHHGRYIMAFLSPSGEENSYKVAWLWDPLTDLRECWEKRTVGGVWIWGEGRKPVDPHELNEEPWQVPNPRANQEANNFSFEIRLNGLKYAAEGLEAILTKLSQLEQT